MEDDGKYKIVCTCGFANRKTDWKPSEKEAVKAWNKIAFNWY